MNLVEIYDRGERLFVPHSRIREIRPPENGKTGPIAVTLNGDDETYSIDPDELDALLNPETIVPAEPGWWGFVAAPGVAIDDAAAQPLPQAMERHPIVGWHVGGEWPEPVFATKPDARRLVAIANIREDVVMDSFGGETRPFADWYREKLAMRLERAGMTQDEFFDKLKRIGEAEAAAAEGDASGDTTTNGDAK